jgi:hypothetical protein
MKALTELTHADLLAEDAALLPDREALGFINIAPVTAVNLALAINAASVGSLASAAAGQFISVSQA